MSTPNQRGFLISPSAMLPQSARRSFRTPRVSATLARFRPLLEKTLRRSNRTKGSRLLFDTVLMFKVLGLQTLYNLADYSL